MSIEKNAPESVKVKNVPGPIKVKMQSAKNASAVVGVGYPPMSVGGMNAYCVSGRNGAPVTLGGIEPMHYWKE